MYRDEIVVFLYNEFDTPESARKPYIRHLRSYFCNAYYYIKPAHRANSDKFTAKAEKGRLIGYADVHGKIYWIWNPVTDKVVKVNAVKFNEGDDYQPDDDIYADIEYEAVFADSTVAEKEDAIANRVSLGKKVTFANEPITIPDPASNSTDSTPGERRERSDSAATQESAPVQDTEKAKDSEPISLPTPDATPEPTFPLLPKSSDVEDEDDFPFIDAEEVADLRSKAPIPPGYNQAPYTTDLPAMREITSPAGERPRRAAAEKKGPGFYKKLHEGKHQGFFTAHLDNPRLCKAVSYALSVTKVDHLLQIINKRHIPKNYRQARKLENYHNY
ncbi:hypothetical protein QBC40DRAFT_166116, partial [Triangularia verruculosa]